MLAKLVSIFAGEKDFEPSVTEPNQSLSISEIMRRFGMGMTNEILQGGNYDESDDEFEDDLTRDASFDFLDASLMEEVLQQQQFAAKQNEDIEISEENNVSTSENAVEVEAKSETITE